MNSQSVLLVWGIHGLPLVSFMVARALVVTGFNAEDEEILLARAVSMVWMWMWKY